MFLHRPVVLLFFFALFSALHADSISVKTEQNEAKKAPFRRGKEMKRREAADNDMEFRVIDHKVAMMGQFNTVNIRQLEKFVRQQIQLKSHDFGSRNTEEALGNDEDGWKSEI
ncbi:hypothetical protein L596_012480 [Steinernema carpocapsae]|uniref:Uncharacterized protein n=1 Tax=Steinernema carpocapsae TaxID=34508 RepID=A0A4U5NX74_STECR|nr:hypothetical protein L596_012480 [Steinernema carpocapsae]